MKLPMAILWLLVAPIFAVQAENSPTLPPDAANALHRATNVVLYSLEPMELTTNRPNLYSFEILGQTKLDGRQARTAIAAFETATAQGAKYVGAHCFSPRHALRVTANGQTYDFLLCYECGWLWVVHDGKGIVELGAIGTPDQLNKLLTAAKIPLAKVQ